MSELDELMAKARNASWERFGRRISFYHPGMFRFDGEWGRYSAISITGGRCELMCDHCGARLLEPMIHATTPEALVKACQDLEKRGDSGCLITGGSSKDGTLPWNNFIDAIRTVKKTTNLHISIHGGMMDQDMAGRMKDAGIDQALPDVVGDDETLKKVFRVDFGIEKIVETLDSLSKAGLPTVPHIVVGLNYGKITGEYNAIKIIERYNPEAVVVVSLMPLSGTPMCGVAPPSPEEIARVIATARLRMPMVPISLGCARDRRNSKIDVLAVDCGVNRMAKPSGEAIKRAHHYGLDVEWQRTCCSVPIRAGVRKDAR